MLATLLEWHIVIQFGRHLLHLPTAGGRSGRSRAFELVLSKGHTLAACADAAILNQELKHIITITLNRLTLYGFVQNAILKRTKEGVMKKATHQIQFVEKF